MSTQTHTHSRRRLSRIRLLAVEPATAPFRVGSYGFAAWPPWSRIRLLAVGGPRGLLGLPHYARVYSTHTHAHARAAGPRRRAYRLWGDVASRWPPPASGYTPLTAWPPPSSPLAIFDPSPPLSIHSRYVFIQLICHAFLRLMSSTPPRSWPSSTPRRPTRPARCPRPAAEPREGSRLGHGPAARGEQGPCRRAGTTSPITPCREHVCSHVQIMYSPGPCISMLEHGVGTLSVSTQARLDRGVDALSQHARAGPVGGEVGPCCRAGVRAAGGRTCRLGRRRFIRVGWSCRLGRRRFIRVR